MSKQKRDDGFQSLLISALDRQWLTPRPRIVDTSTELTARNAIEDLGLLALPTVSLKTKRLLSLHSAVDAWAALGNITIDCWVVDLKPDQEIAAYFALNNHGNSWDWQKVSDMLKALKTAAQPLTPTGFNPAKIKALTHCGDWTPQAPAQLDGEHATQSGFGF